MKKRKEKKMKQTMIPLQGMADKGLPNIQSGQLSKLCVRLVFGRSGVQISPFPIEFSFGGGGRDSKQ